MVMFNHAAWLQTQKNMHMHILRQRTWSWSCIFTTDVYINVRLVMFAGMIMTYWMGNQQVLFGYHLVICQHLRMQR